MAEIGKASLLIVPKFDGLKSKVNSALGEIDTTAGGTKMGKGVSDGVSKGIGGLAGSGAIVGAFSAVTSKAMDAVAAHVGSAVSRLDTLKNYPQVMQSLGVGSKEASASVKTMSDRLSNLPTTLDSMSSTVQGLYAATKDMGVSLTTATYSGLALNDMLLAGGRGTQVASSAMEQFRQMLSKGRPDMQDWKSLLSAAPGQMDQLAKSMLGPTANANDLYSALGGGGAEATVSMSQLLDAIIRVDSEGGAGMASFKNQAVDATGGIQTAADNLSNAFTKGIANVMDAIGRENIAGAIGEVKNGVSEAFSAVASAAPAATDALKGVFGVVKNLAPLAAGATGAFAALKAGKSVIDGLGAVAQGAASAVGGLEGVFMRVAKASGSAGLSGKLVSAALGAQSLATTLAGPVGLALAAAAAGVVALGATLYGAWKGQQDFNAAISEMGGAASRVSSALSGGARGVTDWGGKAQEAAMSTEELTRSVREHNDAMAGIVRPAEETVSLLGQYQTVIDRLAGRGEASAEDAAMLDWALKGLNETLGTSYTAADVLTGSYTDQSGAVVSLRDEIDGLIQKKQEEARVNAYQELYTESLRHQAEAQRNVAAAQGEYNQRLDAEVDRLMRRGNLSRDAAQAEAEMNLALVGEKQKLDDANAAMEAANEEVSDYAEQMGLAQVACTDAGRAMSDFMTSTDGWASALSDTGLSLDELAGACASAGVSTDELSAMGADAFARLAESAGGDVGTLTGMLGTLNALGLDPKTLTVNDDGTITDEMGQVWNLNAQTIDGKHFEVHDDGTISVAELGIDHVRAMEVGNKRFSIDAEDNATSVIESVRSKAAALAGGVFTAVIRGATANAAGGVRMHATGAVLTAPTWIGPHDIAGEAGDEWYDGENIVPLTSQRARPLARVVAQEVARMGDGGTGELAAEVRSLHEDLGRIIAAYAPTMTIREARRVLA